MRRQRLYSFFFLTFIIEIRATSFSSYQSSDLENFTPFSGLEYIQAIDYDFQTGYIYVSENKHKTIHRVSQDGREFEPIVTKTLGKTQGIAVDWMSKNLYWTDAGTHLIEVGGTLK